MEANNLQEIFDKIIDCLPNGWHRFALYSAFTGDMSNSKFYVDCGKGYIDCFKMKYSESMLLELFFDIESILMVERNQLKGKKRWNVFTMFVDSEGNVKAHYDYTNIKKCSIEHQINWEKNYIFNTEKL